MALARHRLTDEGHRILAFAKRNPLTVAGVCVGLIIGVVILQGVEGRIRHVEHQQTVVEQRVVKIGTCSARPNSQACLLGITLAVKRCLDDPTCHNLIAGATVIAVPSPSRGSFRPNPTTPASSVAAPPGALAGGGHPGDAKAPPKSTHGPPDAESPSHDQGHSGGQEGSKSPAEEPQAPAGGEEGGSGGEDGAESAHSGSGSSSAGVAACVGELACIEAELQAPPLFPEHAPLPGR